MESLRSKLRDHGQEHLLRFWEDLSNDQRNLLVQDIVGLDLEEVTSYYTRALASSDSVGKAMLDDEVQPIPENAIASARTVSKEQLEAYRRLGLKEIGEGRVAVLLMAGGQGTRLGVTYPKGLFDVGLPSGKTLLQLQAEKILKLQSIAKDQWGKAGEITWYLMTSEATHDATLDYFERNNYFGLRKKNVRVFEQGMLPCFTLEGKIILDEKYRLSKAPDGNGGLYRALKNQGILDDMVERGIRSVHAHSVDNILVKVADPIFIGYCLSSATDCGVKVVEKSSPTEPVGVVCKVGNCYRVVEYSEITKETAELRRADGRLVYNAGNICNHYFTVDFLSDVGNTHEAVLDLHAAKKKIPFIDDQGNRCTPKTPNGIKVEKFVFDVFKFAKNFAVWECMREAEFSPVKNADSAGKDCPSTARNDVLELHRKWLLDAGAKEVVGGVEVSPLLSYAGENLTRVAQGQSLRGPCVLR